MDIIENKGIFISCQALKNEPLYGKKIMAKMAIAAKMGGAIGIRANTAKDINAIDKALKSSLPIIGLIKKDYSDSQIYITPTLKEVKALIKSRASIIALDFTLRIRPNNEKLEDLVAYIRKNSNKKIMADIATMEDALFAKSLNVDYISTTLRGYTNDTKDIMIPDFDFCKSLVQTIKDVSLVAEGGVKTPEDVKKICETGIKLIVIGGAITRPQLIAKSFTDSFVK